MRGDTLSLTYSEQLTIMCDTFSSENTLWYASGMLFLNEFSVSLNHFLVLLVFSITVCFPGAISSVVLELKFWSSVKFCIVGLFSILLSLI